MRLFPLIALVTMLTGGMERAQTAFLPPDCKVSGKFEQTDSAVTGLPGPDRVTAKLVGPMAALKASLLLKGKTGPQMMGVTVNLKDAAGQSTTLLIRPLENVENPNGVIGLGWKGGWGKVHTRPNRSFYKPEEIAKRKAAWEKLPPASDHLFDLELCPTGDGQLEVWFDGQFMNTLELPSPAVSYEIVLAPEASVESLAFTERSPEFHLNLPVGTVARPEGTADVLLEFDSKTKIPAAFQALAGKEAKGISVGGLGTFPGLGTDDLVSYFWRRHATNSLPEQRMFSVPLEVYSHATILCSTSSQPGTVPEFTLRVTRYGHNRGNAMADSIVRVPPADSAGNPNAVRVGTLRGGTSDGTPLWLVRVPIKNGLIEDLLHTDTSRNNNMGTYRSLDVELLDPLANVDRADAFPPMTDLTNRAFRPWQNNNPVSGVTVFGIELERSPVDLTVRANTGFQVFYRTDHPEFIAKIKAIEAGNYTLQWNIADVSGSIVASGTQEKKVEAGQEQAIAIPIKQDVGWYAMQFRLSDSKNIERVDYRTSFVMLPPDTRKAGLESPFYGWWFQKHQRSDVKLAEVGPLIQRLGVRRAGPAPDMPESETLKYGFTEATLPWTKGRLAMLDYRDGKVTLEQALAAHEAAIRAELAIWPGINRMLVFHESGPKGAPFPSEIWGEPATNNFKHEDENSPEALLAKEGGAVPVEAQKKTADEWQQNWPKRLEYLTGMAKMVREKFPQLKMQFGNDGHSLGLMGELFRQKFPREYIDTIAVEDLGQTFAPERALISGFQSTWFLKETARRMGYGDVPITACTEWIGRMTERLGLQKQAEWKVRDGLHALAYGFDTISFAGINDASTGYYFTGWANGGLCFRYPTLAPKPAYAAVATLTQVLDRAKFQRFIPTGSTVLYVQEFRQDDSWIYAMWTPRGDREVELIFPDDEARVQTDLYGRTRSLSGKTVSLKVSPAAQYLSSKSQIVSVKAGASSFPADLAPDKPMQVVPLESLSEVQIVPSPSIEQSSKARPDVIPHLREGDFELREVTDEKMGKCLELELKPGKELRWPMEHEYVTLQLKAPVSTSATNAGLWIKGNGSWGEVDIQTKSTSPWLGNGDLDLRWPGDATTNFDGWNFIQYPARRPAAVENQVTSLLIRLPRNVLYGTEMAPVENLKIRLKSILLF